MVFFLGLLIPYKISKGRMDMIKLLTLKEVSELLGSKDPKGRMVRELRRKGILPG